jgi:Transglycosylase SLT domain
MSDWRQVCEGGPRHRTTDEGYIEKEGEGIVWVPEKRSAVQKTIDAYGSLIEAACARHGIPPHWLAGLIAMESGGNPGAVSPGVGARGLVQMLPTTATGLGLDPDRLWEPAYAIEAALVYWDRQIARYGDRDLPLLAGTYNAGSRRCAVTTACKTAGVKDGTSATNSWGLVEDCYKGTSSRYVARVVGGANEALRLGFGSGSAWASGAAEQGNAVLNALAFFSVGALACAAVFVYTR